MRDERSREGERQSTRHQTVCVYKNTYVAIFPGWPRNSKITCFDSRLLFSSKVETCWRWNLRHVIITRLNFQRTWNLALVFLALRKHYAVRAKFSSFTPESRNSNHRGIDPILIVAKVAFINKMPLLWGLGYHSSSVHSFHTKSLTKLDNWNAASVGTMQGKTDKLTSMCSRSIAKFQVCKSTQPWEILT